LQTTPVQCDYWNHREGWWPVSGDHTKNELHEILRLIETGRVDLSRSITHRIPLREINQGLELLESNKEHVERVVIDMTRQ
jgi:threonine dehydrogenase-like Zn-dependent dehydrogenase